MNVKICGLKRLEDIEYVNESKPDWIGFVFAGSKRKIDVETAMQLKKELDKEIKAVGVFVNEKIEFILKLVEDEVIDFIQLHGDEEETYIQDLQERLMKKQKNIPIIKAIRVKSTKQILEAQKLTVNYLLLDTFSGKEYGGSGEVFNHNLIPKLEKPYILAGGIDLENVNNILELLSKQGKTPICIDVSSSVETNGYKDREKIDKLVKKVHCFEKCGKIEM